MMKNIAAAMGDEGFEVLTAMVMEISIFYPLSHTSSRRAA
jgi:hypothetical protein